MLHSKRIVMAVIVLAALLVGAVLGRAAGRAIHSDNLPFFTMLGALAGACVGLAIAALRGLAARRERERSRP